MQKPIAGLGEMRCGSGDAEDSTHSRWTDLADQNHAIWREIVRDARVELTMRTPAGSFGRRSSLNFAIRDVRSTLCGRSQSRRPRWNCSFRLVLISRYARMIILR